MPFTAKAPQYGRFLPTGQAKNAEKNFQFNRDADLRRYPQKNSATLSGTIKSLCFSLKKCGIKLYLFGSSAEFVGAFWFWKIAKGLI